MAPSAPCQWSRGRLLLENGQSRFAGLLLESDDHGWLVNLPLLVVDLQPMLASGHPPLIGRSPPNHEVGHPPAMVGEHPPPIGR
jgi:hypothetical protein